MPRASRAAVSRQAGSGRGSAAPRRTSSSSTWSTTTSGARRRWSSAARAIRFAAWAAPAWTPSPGGGGKWQACRGSLESPSPECASSMRMSPAVRAAGAAILASPPAGRAAGGEGSGLVEAVNAVAADGAGGVALGLEVVQVGQCLADGEAQLMCVEPAAEEHRDQVGRGARFGEGIDRLGQALVVVMAQVL